MKLINIGFNNMISRDRVVALLSYDSAPAKRLVQDAKDSGRALDCSGGKKTKTVIITDSGHIVLSSLEGEKLSERISDTPKEEEW